MYKQQNITYDATGSIISAKPIIPVIVNGVNNLAYDPNETLSKVVNIVNLSRDKLDNTKKEYINNVNRLQYLSSQEQLYRDYIQNQESTYLNSLNQIEQKCKSKMMRQAEKFERELVAHKLACQVQKNELVETNNQCQTKLNTMTATYPNVFSSTLLEN